MRGVTPYTEESWKRTNGDQIRNMTDEALAEEICKVELMSAKQGHRGFQAWLNWLKEEAET